MLSHFCILFHSLSSCPKTKSLPVALNYFLFFLSSLFTCALRILRRFAVVKMYLYVAGAVMLQLVILSGAYAQYAEHGQLSTAMVVFVGMWTWFIVEYLYHEHVHLYTYDLFAEKVGFKLVWGCLFFYPFFYGIGVVPLANTVPGGTNDISMSVAVLAILCFLSGWSLTRGANLQKYYIKCGPTPQPFLGMQPVFVPNTKILCSGL